MRAGNADTAQFARSFRPRLELLEDRVQLGDTILGLSAVALWGLGFTSLDTPLTLDLGAHNRGWPDGLFSSLDAAGSLPSFCTLEDSQKVEVSSDTIGNRALTAPGTEKAGWLGIPISASDEALAGQVASHRLGGPALSLSQGLGVDPGVTGAASAALFLVGGVPFSPPAFAGIGDRAPGVLATIDSASSALQRVNLSFDVATGQLAIQGDAGEHTVLEMIASDGFVDVTVDGQNHSSNPASASFDSALAGARGSNVTGVHFEGGGQDTLVLGSQQLAAGFTVQAAGATVVTQDVVTSGPLAIQGPNITVSGALRGTSVALAASGWVNVNAAGRIDAVPLPGRAGGVNPPISIDVAAGTFVNSGQLHADGATGGQITLQAGNILNAGPVTADGTSPGGSGGQVNIGFTGAYIATTAAMVSASGVPGPGGQLIIDGGSTGRLYSSGGQLATGSVGGTVNLFGRDIVLSAATVNVSGEAGGGAVRIGGDVHGRNSAVVNADTVTVTPASTIRADALRSGGGGGVWIWANQTTAFDGAVSARGGPAGGPGGFIDVSGNGDLTYGGSADAGAWSGRSGTLLLDPKNITISDAPAGVFPQFDLIDPHPTGGGGFGTAVSVLNNGNVVVTNPTDNFGGKKAGAVYLFDGLSGALISSLVASHAMDQLGAIDSYGDSGVTALSKGNYLVPSPFWNGNRGAVTWGNSSTGVSGTVSEANSLVGSSPYDYVGEHFAITILSNGNYVVETPSWNGNRGAVTWGSGSSGVSGFISEANSLVGSHPGNGLLSSNPGDRVGLVNALSNGNYVVSSSFWNGKRGAATWGDGSMGVSGTVSDVNSLVGSNPGDQVGYITPLSNGNYLVVTEDWNGGRGAVTWGNGNTGVSGTVSETNSLVGSSPGDQVGSSTYYNILPLSTGNYVIDSPLWNGQRGASTWGDGSTGVSGSISEANSLVGSSPGDQVGYFIRSLSNGNYVVGSPSWNDKRGAVTWGGGSAGASGTLSDANSLVGSNPGDLVGGWYGFHGEVYSGLTTLSNGNYLVESWYWNQNRGAVTWGKGSTGVSGTVTDENSLVGSNSGDVVGYGGVTPLTNGNYVVDSWNWNGSRGAVTWGDGNKGVSGPVSHANSIVGTYPYDDVGYSGVTPLSNGNYVVDSQNWNGSRGAVTWGDGTTGVSGTVSDVNSLIGSNPRDRVGYNGITPLSNGNYVVASSLWNGQRGAVTWESGNTAVSGIVSDTNSLVGSNAGDIDSNLGDQVGSGGVRLLNNGKYFIMSPSWNGSRGAMTWESGNSWVSGAVSDANSLVGTHRDDELYVLITSLSNGNYVVRTRYWNGARGAATWVNGSTGISGTISGSNSLVGTNPYDFVGDLVTPLSNENYVVGIPSWNGNRGAATWANGSTGVSGTASEANSLVGSSPGEYVGYITPLSNGNYVVGSPNWSNQRGAVTWVSGSSGQTLDDLNTMTAQNSLVGSVANAGYGSFGTFNENPIDQTFLATFLTDGGGRVVAGFSDPNQLKYHTGQSQSLTITPAFLTRTLNAGTAVVLQASNDITVNSPIIVSAGGQGGVLTLQAGRSILLNANITTDNGPLTLIANDQLANGVVDSQRDLGSAVITMAPGTALDTGSGTLTVELGDGAGLTNSDSGAITLQSVTAGSVSVVNDGLSPGSDVILGPVTTSGSQRYADPNGTTTATGNLTATYNSITFTDSVAVKDGVTVDAVGSSVIFAGNGTQTLQSGNGASFSNIIHTGIGTLQLTSGLTVTGTLLQVAGTFDANDQPVTVGQEASINGGTYLAGTAPQTFTGGLVITSGVFTSSSGAMTVSGSIAVVRGRLNGEGTVGPVTALGGTVAPGGNNPGILSVAGAVTLFSSTTFSILCNGPTPGSQYSLLSASGPITLGGCTLSLSFGFEPPLGSSFEILTNTSASPISGTFNGLVEGAVFTQGGYQFQITYRGGTGGSSVVLSRLA